MVTLISRNLLTDLSKIVQQKAVVANANPHHRRERERESKGIRDCDSGNQRDRQMERKTDASVG